MEGMRAALLRCVSFGVSGSRADNPRYHGLESFQSIDLKADAIGIKFSTMRDCGVAITGKDWFDEQALK